MNGRLQNELSIERQNDAKVSAMPDYVRRWYVNMKASKKTGATCRDYLNKIEKFLESINPNVRDVATSDINEETVSTYFTSIQTKEKNGELIYTSDSYQQTVWCCLNNFLGYLNRAGLIERNYIQDISKPKNRDLERINENRTLLTERDFRMIINVMKYEKDETLRIRNRAILLLFMNTGMRETALRTITLDDLDMEKHLITIIDKGNKRHQYVLNDIVIDAINEWLCVRYKYSTGKDNHLFLSKRGRILHSNTVDYMVRKYTELALLKPLSPHKLRSGYCSILYKKTGDIEFVRRCVGHSLTSTTQRYIVTNGEEKYKAAEIMGNLLT